MRAKLSLAVMLVTVVVRAVAAQERPSAVPMVGEVRVFSVASRSAVDQLHRAGWLEARGEVVSTEEFPELFRVIGRSWTADTVSSDQFAVPLVKPGALRMVRSSDNPFGVLGGGDLVTNGQPRATRQGPLSCWVYVGRGTRTADAGQTDR